METVKAITIESTINATIDKVWLFWTKPEHITKWNTASDDWHCPIAENDLRLGGNFVFTMAAKDGSFSFDFGGIYDVVKANEHLAYTLGDGRKVDIKFKQTDKGVHITETFEAENTNPIEIQRDGWQAILNNFKRYTEQN